MCKTHLSNTDYYVDMQNSDPTDFIMNHVKNYAEKYSSCLTEKEKEYLLKYKYKIANFYMLPKIHKCQQINSILQTSNSEYVEIKDCLNLMGRPIVAGCASHTHGISL